MTARTVGAGAAIVVAVALGFPVGPVGADEGAVSVERTGTAPMSPVVPGPVVPMTAPPPPQANSDTVHHLYVDQVAGVPRAMAMVELDLGSLPAGAAVTRLVLRATDDAGAQGDVQNVNAAEAAVRACPLVEAFTDGQPAGYDCSEVGLETLGTRDGTGSWSFDLTTMVAWLRSADAPGLALVPAGSPPTTFSVAFVRASVVALATYTLESAAASPTEGNTTPPPTGGAAVPDQPGPGPSLGASPAISPAPIAGPPASTAPDPPHAPVSSQAAAAVDVGSRDAALDEFPSLPRWTVAAAPALVGLAMMAADPRRASQRLWRLLARPGGGTT